MGAGGTGGGGSCNGGTGKQAGGDVGFPPWNIESCPRHLTFWAIKMRCMHVHGVHKH